MGVPIFYRAASSAKVMCFLWNAKDRQHSPARFTTLNLMNWLALLLYFWIYPPPTNSGKCRLRGNPFPTKNAIFLYISFCDCYPVGGRSKLYCSGIYFAKDSTYDRLSNGSTSYERSNEKSWRCWWIFWAAELRRFNQTLDFWENSLLVFAYLLVQLFR